MDDLLDDFDGGLADLVGMEEDRHQEPATVLVVICGGPESCHKLELKVEQLRQKQRWAIFSQTMNFLQLRFDRRGKRVIFHA